MREGFKRFFSDSRTFARPRRKYDARRRGRSRDFSRKEAPQEAVSGKADPCVASSCWQAAGIARPHAAPLGRSDIAPSDDARAPAGRDALSSVLAEKHGITSKAVRDVWKLRTWAWVTKAYWTPEDMSCFLSKHLCASCSKQGVKFGKVHSMPRLRGNRPCARAFRAPVTPCAKSNVRVNALVTCIHAGRALHLLPVSVTDGDCVDCCACVRRWRAKSVRGRCVATSMRSLILLRRVARPAWAARPQQTPRPARRPMPTHGWPRRDGRGPRRCRPWTV